MTKSNAMAIDWNRFYSRGGYSNENSDPASYDDGSDELETYNDDYDTTD